MPRNRGTSSRAVNENVRELMKGYTAAGMIGNAHPESRKMAQGMAAAAALRTKTESRKGRPMRVARRKSGK